MYSEPEDPRILQEIETVRREQRSFSELGYSSRSIRQAIRESESLRSYNSEPIGSRDNIRENIRENDDRSRSRLTREERIAIARSELINAQEITKRSFNNGTFRDLA